VGPRFAGVSSHAAASGDTSCTAGAFFACTDGAHAVSTGPIFPGGPAGDATVVAHATVASTDGAIFGKNCGGQLICSGNQGRPVLGCLCSVGCRGQVRWVAGGLLHPSFFSPFEANS